VDALKKHAADMALEAEAFNACLDSGKYADRVRAGLQAGARVGVGSTPTLFINGRLVTGAQPFEAFQKIIDEELDRARR
jgi:protein-disulfide isomerase